MATTLESYLRIQSPRNSTWPSPPIESYLSVLEPLWARGTSEGVKKAWDTRGRGKKAAFDIVKSAPRPGTRLNKKVARWAKNSYDTIKTDDETIDKIDKKKTAVGVLLKHIWFGKRLGDLMQSWEGFAELAIAVKESTLVLTKVAVKFSRRGLETAAGLDVIHHAIHMSAQVLLPVLHHVVMLAAHVGGAAAGAGVLFSAE